MRDTSWGLLEFDWVQTRTVLYCPVRCSMFLKSYHILALRYFVQYRYKHYGGINALRSIRPLKSMRRFHFQALTCFHSAHSHLHLHCMSFEHVTSRGDPTADSHSVIDRSRGASRLTLHPVSSRRSGLTDSTVALVINLPNLSVRLRTPSTFSCYFVELPTSSTWHSFEERYPLCHPIRPRRVWRVSWSDAYRSIIKINTLSTYKPSRAEQLRFRYILRKHVCTIRSIALCVYYYKTYSDGFSKQRHGARSR